MLRENVDARFEVRGDVMKKPPGWNDFALRYLSILEFRFSKWKTISERHWNKAQTRVADASALQICLPQIEIHNFNSKTHITFFQWFIEGRWQVWCDLQLLRGLGVGSERCWHRYKSMNFQYWISEFKHVLMIQDLNFTSSWGGVFAENERVPPRRKSEYFRDACGAK